MSDFSADAVNNGIRNRVVELIDNAPGGSVKERIRWAARVLHLPFGRVQKYRYDRVTRIEAHEALQIQHYAKGYERLLAEYKSCGRNWLRLLLAAWACWFRLRKARRNR